MRKSLCPDGGFTLVELAIVLMIIGLLIGGVLRGQEMLNNARLTATIKQINSYSGAVATFRDAYGSLPGDMPNALQRLKNCTGASQCANGNGNTVVGTPTLIWIGGQQGIATENTQFWKHLAAFGVISGVNPMAQAPEFGRSHPTAPIGGGFDVVTTIRNPDDPTGSPLDSGLALRMHGNLANPIEDQAVVASPHQAAFIDRKMDDGIPNTGDVQTQAAGALGAQARQDCEAVYAEGRTDTICVMAFLLNR